MHRLLLFAILACALAAFAQPDPDAPPPADLRPEKQVQEMMRQLVPMILAQPPLMMTVPNGVFVVRGGVLAKYDPRSLETEGLVELFGPAPAEGNKANPLANMERLKRLMPGAMLVTEKELLIVIGEHFFRVDRGTLEVLVSVSLFKEQALAPAERLLAVAAPPVLALNGNTLYVTRGNHLLAVNWLDGKVRGMGVLPDPFGGKLPAVGKAVAPKANKRGKPAVNPQAREVVVIGTLLHHADRGGDFWALKADEGGEYLLSGETLEKLLDEKQALDKRLRITGLLTPPAPNDFGKGELAVVKYEILP